MAGRAGAAPFLEWIEQLAGWGLCAAALAAVLAALFLLLFRVPAKASVIFDGARACRKAGRGAIILNGVHNLERLECPWLVEDLVRFHTRDGLEIRATVRRRFRKDPPSLVWYAPRQPRRATALNPLRCVAFAFLCIVTAAWLRW